MDHRQEAEDVKTDIAVACLLLKKLKIIFIAKFKEMKNQNKKISHTKRNQLFPL